MTESTATPSAESTDGFVRACAVGDIPESNALGLQVGEVHVVVVRHGDRFHALNNMCTHSWVFLSEGEVFDGVIDCWLHGSEFDLETGRPLTLPATEPVAVYPVRVDGEDIYVNVTTPIEQES